MPDGASALQLVLGGDPALYSIVALSLYVSLSAVVLAALVALPFGAFLALDNFPGRTFIVVVINAFMGLPPVVVALRSICCSRAPARSARSASCSRRRR